MSLEAWNLLLQHAVLREEGVYSAAAAQLMGLWSILLLGWKVNIMGSSSYQDN
jgi:hypothetical protein